MKSPFSYTPLNEFPYNSRISKNDFQTGIDSKNYVLVAFKPGEALQASELNEVQENFYKHTTLYNLLLKNWLFMGTSFASYDDTAPIYGPSWIGAVPLNPTESVTIGNNIITFKKDWYLIDDKSGLKFWIYNNTEQTVDAISLPVGSYIGLGITYSFVSSSTDSALFDNSGGYTENNTSGADRYQIQVISKFNSPQSESDWLTGLNRPIIEKMTINQYRYLNNLKAG